MAIVDGLITLEQARTSLGWATTDIANNSDLEAYIEACTPVIEDEVGHLIVREETFTFNGGTYAVTLPQRPTAIVSVTENSIVITDYVADLQMGIIYGGTSTASRPFLDGVRNLTIVAATGVATIPQNIQLATRELVRHLWQVGRQGSRPGFGSTQGEQIIPMGFAMPNRVLELLRPSPKFPGFA